MNNLVFKVVHMRRNEIVKNKKEKGENLWRNSSLRIEKGVSLGAVVATQRNQLQGVKKEMSPARG